MDMKEFEITNENVKQYLSSNEKRNHETLNIKSKGIITFEREYGTLKFERRLSHPKETVWKRQSGRQLPIQKRYSGGCLITKELLRGTTVVQLIS
jgi:hypothetical protein